MSEKLLLVDGHSIANRAFYGLPPMTNSQGVHTNALYGFFSILWKVMDEQKPDYLAVAFDTHAPTFRHEQFAEYKGTRSPMPDELREQIPLLQQMVADAGIPVIKHEGWEADDIIGSLAKQKAAQGLTVAVLSGDRDLLQLVDDQITLLIPKTKKDGTELEVYHEQEVFEKYGVSPMGFLHMKALMGDSSDNIPGVPGIGEKTASKLIATYGDLEGVLAHKSEAGGAKLVQNLTEFEEQAKLSLWLATIKTDCAPLEEPVSVNNQTFAAEAFTRDLKEYELKSLLTRVLKKAALEGTSPFETGDGAVPKVSPSAVKAPSLAFTQTLIQTEEAWNAFLNHFPGNNYTLAIDVVKDWQGSPIGLTLGAGSELVYVEPKAEAENLSLFDEPSDFTLDKVAESLASFMTNPNYTKLCFDTKEVYRFFMSRGIDPVAIAFDGKIAAYLLNPTKSSYTPDELSLTWLGETAVTEEEALGTGVKKKTVAELPEKAKLAYTTQVPRIILLAREAMEQAVAENGMESLYRKIELPLAKVLASMENAGIKCDAKVLKEFSAYLSDEIAKMESRIYQETGCEFNINSPKQLGEILFDKLGLPADKKTKTGYSTSADILEKLAYEYPVVLDILNYRQLTKLKSTYAEGLAAFINPSDGRIHGRFNQTVTATGRLSSTDPNLQNIPIRMELGRELRKAFVPENQDYFFMDADYSQIELRLLAHMSGDEKLVTAYREGQDIHRATAASVLHKKPEEVTSAERSSAKAVNFGIIYGQTAFGLSEGVGISPKEAGKYIKDYFAQYPSVEGFLNECVQKAKATGYGETLYGRRRPIEELKNSNFMQRSFGERVAKNMPIQGTAADIIKIAMIRVYNRLQKEGLKSRLLVQVHDELLLEVYRPEEAQVKALLKEEMEGAANLSVPLEADIHSGENWYEAK